MDATDVTVWHKISKLALSLHQYSLARHAYEQVDNQYLLESHEDLSF